MYLHDELQFLFFYQWLSDCFTSLKLCKWKTKAVDIRARTHGKKSTFSEAILSPISSLAWQEFSVFLCWWWKSGKDKQAITRYTYAKKLLKTINLHNINAQSPGIDILCGLSLLLVFSHSREVILWVLQFFPLLKIQQIPVQSGIHV